eukprot:187388-Pyramimonas_sp.AAC.1
MGPPRPSPLPPPPPLPKTLHAFPRGQGARGINLALAAFLAPRGRRMLKRALLHLGRRWSENRFACRPARDRR